MFVTRFSPNPAEQQRRLVEEFDHSLTQSHFLQWHPGDAIPTGTFILVGVMVGWNTYDQELAAALDEALAEGRAEGDTVAILAADRLHSTEEVESIFRGLPAASAPTPYLSLWEDGRPRLVDWGGSAMAFLSDRYGLSLP